jgi:hypothetical protein
MIIINQQHRHAVVHAWGIKRLKISWACNIVDETHSRFTNNSRKHHIVDSYIFKQAYKYSSPTQLSISSHTREGEKSYYRNSISFESHYLKLIEAQPHARDFGIYW